MLRSPERARTSSLTNLSRTSSESSMAKRKRRESGGDIRDDIKDMLNDWKRQQDAKDEELHRKLESMENQMAELISSNTECKKILETNRLVYNELKNRCDMIADDHKIALNRIAVLEERLEDIERKRNENSIEISNIPKDNVIKVEETISRLHKLLNTQINMEDIKKIQRTGQKNIVVVEYNDVKFKEEIIKSLKAYNTTNATKLNTEDVEIKGDKKYIFISDLLTQTSKKIHFIARRLKKDGKIKYCWISRGRVMIRQNDGNPAICLKSITQTQELLLTL